jgi:hypothetical protein
VPGFLHSLFARPDPPAEFRGRQAELLALWFDTAATSGKPKGLTWQGYEPLGEPLFGGGWAVLPLLVQFAPTPDGGLEDVPQAKEPRAVVAVFAYARRRWSTSGRTVFNLSPAQVAEQLARLK